MKTKPQDQSVPAYLDGLENAGRREDAFTLIDIYKRVTGAEPVMWGDSLIGFGTYEYERADKSKHTFFVAGFAPRKANMVVYLMTGVEQYAAKLEKLGKYKHSVSCLYLPRFKSLDLSVLEDVIADDIEKMKAKYPVSL